MSITLETAQSKGYVVGLKGESGMQPRRELDDLMVNEPDCFNLYVLALARIMQDENGAQDKMNYFQIAGIHGLPLRDWDHVQNPDAMKEPGSYCTHGSFLFPSWHRPYLAMLEQTLYSAMKDIAGEFSDTKYVEAAKRFRLPYWDWIKPRDKRTTTFPGVVMDDDNLFQKGWTGKRVSFPFNYDLPAVLQLEKLMVYLPHTVNGADETKLVPFDNPFYSYTFPKQGSISTKEWTALDARDRKGTLHASRTKTTRNPTQDPEHDNFTVCSERLNMMREASVINALDLISPKYTKYLDFAAESPRWNKDETERLGPAGSLEDIHNRYHGLTGGNGHMGRVPTAAFDPVFWLHHCNVDRILAVWQATHSGPDSYLPPGKTLKYGQEIPLWPFRRDGRDSFWDSSMVQDLRVFGYTYKDIEMQTSEIADVWDQTYRWSLQSNGLAGPPKFVKIQDPRLAQVFKFDPAEPSTKTSLARLNEILPPKPRTLQKKERAIQAEDAQAPGEVTVTAQRKAEPVQPMAPEPVFAESQAIPDLVVPEVQKLLKADEPEVVPIVEWYIDVEVERDALNGAFTVFYFLGSAATMAHLDADPQNNYPVAPILAGMTHVFTAPKEACDACNLNAERGVIVTGTSPISPMLRDYVRQNSDHLRGLGAEEVVPFLKKNLYWRVLGMNNIAVPVEDVRGLKVEVGSTIAVQRLGSGTPVAWEARDWPEATAGHTREGNPGV